HIDPNIRIRRKSAEEHAQDRKQPGGRRTDYDDLWDLEKKEPEDAPDRRGRRWPEEPEKDLLRFLVEYAPNLEDWQRDVLSIVRAEMLYFLPQMHTKIMNEGWASLGHVRIMREMGLDTDEHMEFIRLHSSVLSPPPAHRSINPYYVGYRIFEDIERRWNGDLT